jgi:hypothetical protein
MLSARELEIVSFTFDSLKIENFTANHGRASIPQILIRPGLLVRRFVAMRTVPDESSHVSLYLGVHIASLGPDDDFHENDFYHPAHRFHLSSKLACPSFPRNASGQFESLKSVF